MFAYLWYGVNTSPVTPRASRCSWKPLPKAGSVPYPRYFHSASAPSAGAQASANVPSSRQRRPIRNNTKGVARKIRFDAFVSTASPVTSPAAIAHSTRRVW